MAVQKMEASETTKNSCAMLHPKILSLVKQCLLSESINSQGNTLEVKWPKSSSLEVGNTSNCDRFTMDIPYCGTQIPWEIIFDRNHLEDPPDFIFSTQDEVTNFNPSLENLPSLLEWSVDNDGSLCSLLEELLAEYRAHHKSKLQQHDRMSYEMDVLLEDGRYADMDVLCTFASSSSPPIVRFFFPLPLDSLAIPAFFSKENPGPDKAALVVQFPSPKSTKPIPSLHISPRIERMLGDSGDVRLPQWGGDNTSLADYVPLVHQQLRERVETISLSYVRRKEYMAACLSFMGAAVLEYDTEQYKIIAFLFETQGFSFISRYLVELPPSPPILLTRVQLFATVFPETTAIFIPCDHQVNLSDTFPSDQPSLTLQSVYHKFHQLPCLSIIKDYPYSPRWSANEMAERIRQYILSVAAQFREISQEQGECLG